MRPLIALLLLALLAGCETYRTFDLPRECGGSLERLRARASVPYAVIETDLPHGTWGQTKRLDAGGPAIILIDRSLNRLNRETAEQHELCHLVVGSFHAEPPPTKGNVTRPERGAGWDSRGLAP